MRSRLFWLKVKKSPIHGIDDYESTRSVWGELYSTRDLDIGHRRIIAGPVYGSMSSWYPNQGPLSVMTALRVKEVL